MREEAEDQGNSHLCVGCGISVDDCKCIWNAFRELNEIVSSLTRTVVNHWDLNYQGDCNLSKRMVILEENYQGLFADTEYLDEIRQDHESRIKDLENRFPNLKYKSLMEIEKDIEKLRNEFEQKLDVDLSKWHEYYGKVFVSKKPYKCPICDGKRIDKEPLIGSGGLRFDKCYSCEGRGIVWG